MSQFYLYNKLSTCSKRYWQKIARKPKLLSKVQFRKDLIERLSIELNLDFDATYELLMKELYEYVEANKLKY